jgi:hypothetical protein
MFPLVKKLLSFRKIRFFASWQKCEFIRNPIFCFFPKRNQMGFRIYALGLKAERFVRNDGTFDL